MVAITLDGSTGGGQMLRFALAFSILTKKPFKMIKIRAARPKPGIAHQHLFAIRACQQLSNAKVQGAELGSTELLFIPGASPHVTDPKQKQLRHVRVVLPTAGSLTLLLQSLLPLVATGKKSSTFLLAGGTDVPFSMPYAYVEHVLFWHLRPWMQITSMMHRPGFYPEGGGLLELKIKPLYEHAHDAPPLVVGYPTQLVLIKVLLLATAQAKPFAERMQELLSVSLQQRYHVPVQAVVHIPSASSSFPSSFADMQVQAQPKYQQPMLSATVIGIANQRCYSLGSRACSPSSQHPANAFGDPNPLLLAQGADALFSPLPQTPELACKQLLTRIDFFSVDLHLLDNLVPYLFLFGGSMPAATSPHIETGIFVGKAFFETEPAIHDGFFVLDPTKKCT
ncbi:MAG: RNA 3'-terminal phosphate cyclase [Candidatus Woesearchaeota archaeon]